MQSIGRLMDWTLEDNMVDGLFFYAILTGRRGGHTPFLHTGAETSDTGAEAVKPDSGSSWEGHSEVFRCRGWKCGSLWDCRSTLHSIGNPPTAPHVCCYYQINKWDVVPRVQMGVLIWGAVFLHSMGGWALSGANDQAPWYGVLETMWFLYDEDQQVECLRGLEGCSLVWDAVIQSQLARRRWCQGQWGGYERCGTKQAGSTRWLSAPGLG